MRKRKKNMNDGKEEYLERDEEEGEKHGNDEKCVYETERCLVGSMD